MFSVCGLLCRFLRGWRQSEAVNFMAQAAVLSDGSLLVEATHLESGTGKKENISMFCQPFCGIPETREVQLIWRDNNKQASIISPKEKIDLLRWTLCLYHSGIQSCPTSVSSTPLNSTSASRRNSDVPEGSENIITVLLEATYREKGEESLYGYDVNVEQLAEPYAWKSKDIFGIIIKTTPKKLVSMIHAFFNNALIIDEDLSIRKIITVDLVGEIGESVLGDPATISDNVSPGPWSCKQGNLSQMKLSRLINAFPPGLGNEISNSNPNLSGVSSPFVRGMPLSSSFTSSPFRRPHSVASNFSPGRRVFNTQGTNITTPDESSPATPLVEVDEEFEPVRVNTDNQNLRPPNVLVYTANNVPYYDSVKETLENSFNKDRYVVYHLTNDMAFKSPWAGNTTLLVICGDVASHVSTTFIRYLLDGGRVLSICSDFLNVAVPLFGTVEVQEASVVSMSYSRWKNVQLLHHQHCFHSSPKHKRFSKDLEKKHSNSGSAVSVEPTYVEITDEYGIHHRLDLTVLAKDDTWGAPSLLVANVNDGKGKALFSQVHLEKNPNQCIAVDLTGEQLKRCNAARLEILRDLLHSHLGLDTTIELNKDIFYTSAYLLGRHEHKQKFLEDVKPFVSNGEFARLNMTLKFQKENIGEKRTFKENLPDKKPSKEYLPVLMTAYPNNFSTVKYFEALKTETIGRLAIYCDTLSSTMDILSGKHLLSNGMVAITSQQTGGKGRQGNLWLSPLGCAMFSIQLHIPLTSKMGQCLPFLQHLVALSIVLAVKGTEGYEHIPLALKWPNDIYLNSDTKIGGIIVEASTQKGYVIANIGCGVNLSNSNPTTCINDAIRIYNEEHCTMLLEFERETFYAIVFNNIEQLLEDYQTKGAAAVMQKYYKHWLHGNACVTVVNEMGQSEKATIIGIDHYGFLVARLQSSEIINLHPDGNSFNMMDGLIFTKIPRS